MAKTIQISIQTKADLAGVQAVQKAIQGLGQATAKISTAGGAGAAKPFKDTGDAALKAERDVLRYASSLAAVQKAQGNAAGAAQTWRMALAQLTPNTIEANRATVQLTQAQNALDKSARQANGGMAVLPRTIAGLSHEAAAFATASLSMGAAVGVATATVKSFADAFQFKAQLDATTLAINAQLQGVRESSQVWDQASAFAQRFKLTQEETTNAISASIGVMRASKAPVEDILGVLARMQVLSPEQSLQEAAIALKALASGDTTSLVTRFEVGRDVANQMKAEIQGGADAVAVMSQFLGDTGIGMDVLATKTQGAAGAIKDLAIAQEELKIAQAEFAQGPGLVILEGQIRATTGATRVLTGDVGAMGESLQNSATAFLANAAGAAAYAAAIAAGQSASEANFAAVEAQANATAMLTGVQRDGGGGAFEFANATNTLTTAMSAESAAAMTAAAAIQTQTAAAQAAATESLIDAAAKEEEAAKTALLTAETTAAVSAFLALHPGITASGVASLSAASSIDPLLLKLIQATLRAREAAAALAQFNIVSGVKAAGGNFAQADRADADADKRAFRAEQQASRNRVALAQTTAERERTLAIGTTDAKIALYQKDYNAAVKLHGASSTQAYEAQTQLLKAQQTGGAARTSAAGAAASKLEGIEAKTGDKLSQIVQDTQAKLVEIDRKAADERARIAAELENKLATSAADRRAANEADDLDLIGVTDEKEAQKLNDRERAQAAAREREVAAAKEAQDAIANGEAESASKVYDIRQKQISDQQALDEKYYDKQREFAENPDALAALKTQYDEGTRANDEAAQTRIDIAKAEAQAKDQALIDEKAAVIQAANDQANDVISAAERSATGVKAASGAAKKQAVEDLQAIGNAVTAIPASKTITITVNQQGSVSTSSAGSGARAAGGGTFIASKPMKLTVGDAPDPEMVTVTPLGRKGQTRAGAGWAKLAGGGTVIDAGGGYTTPIAGVDLPKGKKGKGKGGPAAVDPKKALDEMKNTIQLLMDMARLKEQIAALKDVPAFDIPTVQALVDRAQEFTAYVNSKLVPLTKAEGESLGRYLSAAKDAASLISDMASLKKDIAELKDVPAFDQPTVLALIDRAEQFTRAVQQHLIPLTEFERDQIGRYTDVVSDVVSMLSDVADLKKELAEPAPPIDTNYIWQLVSDAAAVTIIMRERLVGTTEEQADAVGRYASAAGDTISILNNVLDLGKNLKEAGAGDIPEAMIIRLADQAKRITELVSARLIPTTEEQAEAASRYADLVGSSTSALKDVLDLGGKLFTDYTSPTDAQIAMLANDAKRITDGFFKAGAVLGKEGAEAGKAYAEGVGAAFSAAKDGLLVIDALKSGDFVLPAGALAQFQSSSMSILGTMQLLGARASQIPGADIAALQGVTAAISGQAEAMIRLAAVPFGDLGGVASGLSGSGGSLGPTTIYNTFNLPQGSNQQTAQEVIRILNQQMGTRR